MKFLITLAITLAVALASAQVPDNLVTENIPSFTSELRADVGRYLNFAGPRSAPGIRNAARCLSSRALPTRRSCTS